MHVLQTLLHNLFSQNHISPSTAVRAHSHASMVKSVCQVNLSVVVGQLTVLTRVTRTRCGVVSHLVPIKLSMCVLVILL